ncbi:Neurogenic differentiation factor 1, partial [Ophiophagus hannah]
MRGDPFLVPLPTGDPCHYSQGEEAREWLLYSPQPGRQESPDREMESRKGRGGRKEGKEREERERERERRGREERKEERKRKKEKNNMFYTRASFKGKMSYFTTGCHSLHYLPGAAIGNGELAEAVFVGTRVRQAAFLKGGKKVLDPLEDGNGVFSASVEPDKNRAGQTPNLPTTEKEEIKLLPEIDIMELTSQVEPRFLYAILMPHLVPCAASPSKCSSYSAPPQSANPGMVIGHSFRHIAGRCNCGIAPLHPCNIFRSPSTVCHPSLFRGDLPEPPSEASSSPSLKGILRWPDGLFYLTYLTFETLRNTPAGGMDSSPTTVLRALRLRFGLGSSTHSFTTFCTTAAIFPSAACGRKAREGACAECPFALTPATALHETFRSGSKTAHAYWTNPSPRSRKERQLHPRSSRGGRWQAQKYAQAQRRPSIKIPFACVAHAARPQSRAHARANAGQVWLAVMGVVVQLHKRRIGVTFLSPTTIALPYILNCLFPLLFGCWREAGRRLNSIFTALSGTFRLCKAGKNIWSRKVAGNCQNKSSDLLQLCLRLPGGLRDPLTVLTDEGTL